jgi:threonine dehydrogenase-like Zn-dependent dehydrogenase
MAEKTWGHSPCGIFGSSRLLGGFAGGQAELVRVPFADVGPLKVPQGLTDEQVLFLSDVFPTGYMAAEMCNVAPGQVVAVWGAGPVGQFAIASAKLLGAERIICIDRIPYRLELAEARAGATDVVNYEAEDVYEALQEMTGGRGPDAAIDAVGFEAGGHGAMYAYDRAKQDVRSESDRPMALRQAIRCVRNGGIVSVAGVYGGVVDGFPMGSIVNRALTIRGGPCHVQRYMGPLLERIQRKEIDPTFIITHTMPLEKAAEAYDLFANRKQGCEKVVLKAA